MSERKLHVLVVDDDPTDLQLIAWQIGEVPEWDARVECSTDPLDALDLLSRRSPDVVLLDHQVGPRNGLELLAELQRHGYEGPVILLSSRGDEHTSAEALRAGAADCVSKALLSPRVLRRAITNAVEKSELLGTVRRHRASLVAANLDLERRDEEVVDFYRTVGRELVAPLDAARRLLSILLDGIAGQLTSTQREYLEVAVESCDHAASRLDDLLEVRRLRTGDLAFEPAPCAVRELVDGVLAGFSERAAARGVTLECDVPHDLAPAFADGARVASVLGELLDNALKFTPRGGRVELGVRPAADRERALEFRVADTGCGMPAWKRRHLFDHDLDRELAAGDEQGAPRHGGAAGLGLDLAHGLVQLHGGELDVESEPGRGSVIRFTLPAWSARRRAG